MSDVTRILSKIETGDSSATAELLPLVYQELRRLAEAKMAAERPDHTLNATALVHEAYLRLVKSSTDDWQSRGHFFAAAAEAMRRILIERARKQAVRRRHGLAHRVDHWDDAAAWRNEELLRLDEALSDLEQHDEQAARLVKLRFFAGLTHDEAAQAIGVTRRVGDRIWRVARAWLARELRGGGD